MYKMVNFGMLEIIIGCISIGKEFVVFYVYGGSMEDEKEDSKVIFIECVIKNVESWNFLFNSCIIEEIYFSYVFYWL